MRYSLNSTQFYVDETSGQVFLISKLIFQKSSSSNYDTLTIGATNGATQISELNTISIINSNNSPPEFITSQRTFEIKEVIFLISFYLN